MKFLLWTMLGVFGVLSAIAQPINVVGVSVTGRFNSCSGSNLPTVSANLISGTGSTVNGGIFSCQNICDSSKIRITISGIRWSKSPNAEWLHGIFMPASAGFSVNPVSIPAGFITYNAGCVGMCASGSGTNGGPGFYFDNTSGNACCGTVVSGDGFPCNNYGDATIDCGGSFSMTFDVTFCNSMISTTNYQFILTGTSDGETGCYNFNDLQPHHIAFTIMTQPCTPQAINPTATAPTRSCTGSNTNYTSTLSGTCSGNTIYWWSAATGGTLLGTGSPFVYDPPGSACPAGTTLYATCCAGNNTVCVSRIPVTIPGVCDNLSIGNVSITNTQCGILGSVNGVNVLHAQGSVMYSLMPGSLSNTTGVFSALNQTIYTLTATDAGGCTASTIINVLQPLPLSFATPVIVPVSCTAPNAGQISVSASGGTGSISYSILPTATQATTGVFTGLSAQAYTITAIDAAGCSHSTVVQIATPPIVNLSNLFISPVSCFNQSNAQVQAIANGGSGVLSYTLQPIAVTNTSGLFSGLSAGLYTMHVQDILGCVHDTTFVIQNPSAVQIDSVHVNGITCSNLNNGAIQVYAGGGTGALSYTLQPGLFSNPNGIFTGLVPVNYTLTVSDANACSQSTFVNVVAAAPILFNTPLITSPTCFADSNGMIQVTATGGTGNISYTLQPGSINNASGLFVSLSAGIYTLTASDANACSASTIVTLNQPNAVSINTLTGLDPLCTGTADGTITALATGGTGLLTYTLLPTGLSNTNGLFVGLSAGMYTIQVNDAQGCSQQQSISLQNPIALSWSTVTSNAVLCYGGNTGSIQAQAIGGSGTKQYTLFPTATTNSSGSFSNLTAGTYTMQVSDAHACTLSTLVVINQPNALTWTSATADSVSCYGGNNGSLQVNLSGGTASYLYQILPAGPSNSTGLFNGLNAGAYTLQGTDAHGCSISTQLSLGTPSALFIDSMLSTQASCFPGHDAQLIVYAHGGVSPFQYSIGSGWQSSNTFLSLGIGNYTVVVSDTHGCTSTSNVNISTPFAPILTITSSQAVSCHGYATGSFVSNGSGGTGPLSYHLLPLGTINTNGLFTNLNAGVYTVQLIDSLGCSDVEVLNISEPSALQWTNTSTDSVVCAGTSTGAIHLHAQGGTGIIQYQLNAGISNTSGNFTALAAGQYTVVATDVNGCSISYILTVSEAPVLSWNSINHQDISCYGGNNGMIQAQAIGGSGGISYTLQPGGIMNSTGMFPSLSVGSYTLTAQDAHGCSISSIVILSQPSLLQIPAATATQPSCIPGNDAIITLSAIGGTPAYQYSIGAGWQSSSTFSGIGIGVYTVQVKDAKGCTVSTTMPIFNANAPHIDSTHSSMATCAPGNDASINVFVSGAHPPYTYSINASAFQVSSVYNNLSAGSYTITVRDSLLCSHSQVVVVNTTASPQINTINTGYASCVPGCDATATISALGGASGIFSYSVNSINYQSSNVFTGLCTGNYTMSVKDGNGCTATSISSINTANGPTINLQSSNNVLCHGMASGTLQVLAIGGSGMLNYTLMPGSVNNTNGLFPNLTANAYTVIVSDANQCTMSLAAVLSEPALLQFGSINAGASLCNGLPGGTLQVPVTGGTGPYSYIINPTATYIPPSSFSNLLGNVTYTVQVSDANNCSINTTVYVTQPAALHIDTLQISSVSCAGANNGSIQIYGSGGNGILSYTLQPGNLSNTNGLFTALAGNNYTITITDANGCSLSTTLIITEPPSISININTTNTLSCHNANDAQWQVQCTGGAGGFLYSLSPGGMSNSSGLFTNLSANLYTLVVSDASGCSLSLTHLFANPTAVVWDSIQVNTITCHGNNNGAIHAYGSGGIGSLSYQLLPGGVTNSSGLFTALSAGNYTIVASDINVCSISTVATIVQPNPINFSLTLTQNLSCYGAADGIIQTTASGGSSPYTFTLQPTSITNTNGLFSALSSNLYTVQLIDAQGCTQSLGPILLQEPPQIHWTQVNTTSIACYGDTTGILDASNTGGSGSFTYTLQPIAGTQTANGHYTGLPAGTYTLTATDAIGCSASTQTTITQNAKLHLSRLDKLMPTCYGEKNGSLYAVADGGVNPYQYSLSGGPLSSSGLFTAITSGSYLLHVVDAVGCTYDTLLFLPQPALLGADPINIQSTSCSNSSDGSIMVIPQGGRAPFTFYLYPGPKVNTSGNFSGLSQGNFTLQIKDSAGCRYDTTVSIAAPQNPLVVSISKQDLACTGTGFEGWAQAIVNGGTAPYQYYWNTTPPQYDSRIEQLYFGWYQVDVQDANGCKIKDTVYIEPGNCCEAVFIPNAFSPNQDGTNDIFKLTTTAGLKLVQFEIYNRWGNKVWRTTDFREGWNGYEQGKPAATDTYFYILRYYCLTDGHLYTRKGDLMLIR